MFSIEHNTNFSLSRVQLHTWLQAIYLTEGGSPPRPRRALSVKLALVFDPDLTGRYSGDIRGSAQQYPKLE
jgi:hypothetical protein